MGKQISKWIIFNYSILFMSYFFHELLLEKVSHDEEASKQFHNDISLVFYNTLMLSKDFPWKLAGKK